MCVSLEDIEGTYNMCLLICLPKLAALVIYPNRTYLTLAQCGSILASDQYQIGHKGVRGLRHLLQAQYLVVLQMYDSAVYRTSQHSAERLQLSKWISHGFLLVMDMNTSLLSVHIMSGVNCISGPMQPLFYCMRVNCLCLWPCGKH